MAARADRGGPGSNPLMQPGASHMYDGDPGDEQSGGGWREPAGQVEAWRLHVLLQAGYPVYLAEQIAVSGADLHRAVALVAAGCQYRTAADILL